MKTKQDKKQNKKQNQENETKKETAFGPFSTQLKVVANFARFAIFKESARCIIVPSTNFWNFFSIGFKAINIYHLEGKLEIALMD